MGSILILIAIGLLYGGYKLLEAVINAISSGVKSSKAHFGIDRTKNILERNQDIITKYWGYISADNQRYSTEHKISRIRSAKFRTGKGVPILVRHIANGYPPGSNGPTSLRIISG